MKEKLPVMADDGPPLPPNYVSFLQLKHRWLQQQQQSSKSNSQSTVNLKDDSASVPSPIVNHSKPEVTVHDSGSKIANDAVSSGSNRNRIVSQQVTVHDSGSKSPNHTVPRGRNRDRINNQLKPAPDSASEIPNDVVVPRGRNRNRVVNEVKHEVTVHDAGSKSPNEAVPRGRNRNRAVNRLKTQITIVEKQQQDTDESNSKLLKKKGSRGRNPRFVTDQNQTGSSTEPEPERVQEKKQHSYKGRRWNRKPEDRSQEVKGQTAALGKNVEELLSHDESGGDDVKEIHVSSVKQGTNRGRGYGKLYGGPRNGPARPPARRGQVTGVWVKKGESVPN